MNDSDLSDRTAAAWRGLPPLLLLLLLLAPIAIAQDKPGGWQGTAEAVEDPVAALEGGGARLSEADQARYDRVALALVETINARDRERYRALFTDAGWSSSISWWQEMFQPQIDGFGKIAEAYAPQPGLIRVGSIAAGVDAETQRGATFLVRFEEPAGGVLTFRLDDHDRIVETDVFVNRQLGLKAPEGGRLIYSE